jgi:hypothetical protein
MVGTELQVFKNEKSHPLALLRSYLSLFGPAALEWEPFVIKRSVEDRLKFNIPRVVLMKLMAAITVANHDTFWESWETFHAVSQALVGKIPSVSHIDNQSVSDIMLAVDAATRIRMDLGSLGDVPLYSEEVRRYMAAQLHESGIWYVPEPLEFLNPLISKTTQVCGECGNEEEPKEDGLCSYCTDRYNTDSLLKMEPDEELRKKFDGSKVKVVVKLPTAGVQKSLVRALSVGGHVLKETADDICASKLLEAIGDLYEFTASVESVKTAGIANVPKAVAANNVVNDDNQIQMPGTEPKKSESKIMRYATPTAVGGTALLGAALLRNPAQAGKFLTTAKEVITKPLTSIGRGLRSGASYVGPGADEFAQQAAKSKRVELMTGAVRDLDSTLQANIAGGKPLVGQVDQFKALEGGADGAQGIADRLRKSGFLSAGRQKYRNVEIDTDTAAEVNKLVKELDSAAETGGQVDYGKIEALYNRLGDTARQQAAAGTASMRRGGFYYGIGERVPEAGAPVLSFVGSASQKEDPQTGEQRSVAERIARGLTAGAITAGTGALFTGRNLGLSKKDLFTGEARSGLSAKGLVPILGGMGLGATVENVGADLAGGAVNLVDSAFGQKKDQQP